MSASMQRLGLPHPKKVAIFRALQLGDMLNAVPALRALRTAFPEAQISLVGLPWAQEFVKRFRSYLDTFIPFPGFPGFPEQTPNVARFPSFLSEIQAQSFDLAIQMQGSGEISNSLMGLWGAKQYAGFYLPGNYCPDKDAFLEYPDNEPEAWRHLRLMEFLGIPLQGDELEFPLFKEDWRALQQIKEDFHLQEDYVCIHPGARKAERRWPTGYFAGVADGLAALGFQVVLTGTKEEAHLTAAVAQQMEVSAVDLAGKTSLGALAALVSRAHLVVSNDTGISHVAAALKTPSVILFAVPDFVRWVPQNRQLHKPIWQVMDMASEEVLSQVQRHLEEVYAHAR